jgi:hypothetical protein
MIGEDVEKEEKIGSTMGDDALLNTLSLIVPKVKDHTNNQACEPHVMGETKKQDSDYEGKDGESSRLNPLNPGVNEQPDKETPCEQLLNKGSHENSAEKLHENEKANWRLKS